MNEYDISPTGKQTKQSPCGAYNDIRMNTGQVQSMPRLETTWDYRLQALICVSMEVRSPMSDYSESSEKAIADEG